MAITTVLFDLDGTIIDTNELIIQSFLHTLAGETDSPFSREAIIPHMGFALLEQLRFFTGRPEVEGLAVKYRQFNLSKHDELVLEFPHVREVLSELASRSIRMGVVTNKMRLTTEMGLRKCGLAAFMEVVVTSDDVERGKPEPDPVLVALEKMSVTAQETLMVGDSQYDIVAGQKAGVHTAGVAWSLKGEEYLLSYKPDYMLRDMRDLLYIVGTRGNNP